jgi:multiple sugar transport system permease protein
MTSPVHGQRLARRRFFSRHGSGLITYLLLAVVAVFVLLPLFWLLSTAFKPARDAFALPPRYLTALNLGSFREIFSGEFSHYLLNSVIVAASSTLVALLLGVPAGYTFARSKVPGARLLNTWFVIAYIAPPVVFIIPMYIMYQHLHLLDTYQGLILAYETGLLPFTIWLMRVYFTDIPRELDEAAWIDGCSKLGALWKVVLPTVWPGLTTVGLLVGLASWGEYFGALILTGQNTETAPVAVEGYIGTTFANWNELAAAGVVVVVPALLATILVQRGFIRGLTFGAVKQ